MPPNDCTIKTLSLELSERSPNTKESPSLPQFTTNVTPSDTIVTSFCPIGTLTIIIASIIWAATAFATSFQSILLRSQDSSQRSPKITTMPIKLSTSFTYAPSCKLFFLVCLDQFPYSPHCNFNCRLCVMHHRVIHAQRIPFLVPYYQEIGAAPNP